MGPIDDAAAQSEPDLVELLAEQAWLRCLARALVGESGADDLSQDVVTAALQQRPEVRDGLRPWLARVARRLALQRWRHAERRERRERAAARGEAEPSAADVVERVQLQRTVVDATLQLDEPYRTTLLLRFYDGLSLSDVARRCGVPLETARTRLRRGLDTLRARLDQSCGDRAAWAAPLGVLARGPAPLLAAFAGGVLMTTQGKVLVGGLAVLMLAWLVWYATPGAASEVPAVPAAGPVAQAAPFARASGAAATAAAELPAPPAADRIAAPIANGVRIFGRSVAAESGVPLGGCRVDLFVSPVDVDTAGSREPDASATTAADGCFCIEWALAVPIHVGLYLRADHRGRVNRQWQRVEGGDLDCGDVALSPGAVLLGRALDERGVPVRGVQVAWHLQQPLQDRWRQQLVFAASGADGALQGNDVLVPGSWHLSCSSQHQLLRPDLVEVALGTTTVPVDVVVRRTEELPGITGIVVDAAGAPVRNLLLYAHRSQGSDLQSITKPDGAFAFVRKDGTDEPVQLRVFGRYRLQDAGKQYAWGTRDLRVSVLGPAEAQLFVVDAAGAPVTRFALRLQSIAGDRSTRLSLAQVAEHLRDGALVLRELPPDRYRVAVLPEDPACGSCAGAEWELQDGAVLRLALATPAPLRVTVRLPDGAPVEGSRVQLLRSESGAELRLDCRTVLLRETFARSQPGADDGVVVDESATGDEGAAVLRGPAGESFAVRALGPAHAPLLQSGIVLPPGGSELVLHVVRGAAVRGRLFPRTVLDLLQPQAEAIRAAAGPDADMEAWMASRAPKLALVEVGGARRRLPLGTELGLHIDADGSFRFDGVPAGNWTLSLRHWRDVANGGGRLKYLELAKVLDLRDGEVRQLDLDIAPTQPGRVSGLVLFDGQPWRQSRVSLDGVETQTDVDGRFTADLDAGSYWLRLLPAGDASPASAACADQAVDVVPGLPVEHTFDMRRRVLHVRVLESDGAPASQRLILLRGGMQSDAPEHDADGWITIAPVPHRPIEVLTYPRGFDATARAATAPAARQGLVIRLGPATVPADQQEARVELRIPPGK